MQTDDTNVQAADTDFLGMGDDEILNMQPPEPNAEAVTPDPDPAVDPVVETAPGSDEADPDKITKTPEELEIERLAAEKEATDKAAAEADDANKPTGGEEEELGEDGKPKTTPKEVQGEAAAGDPGAGGATPGQAAAKKDGKAAEPITEKVDYEAEYNKIMAPFKANGREIQLKSPEEVTKLMQMGAHYTKKMQALQPVLRVVKMLENNQLLDEGQLSYLIDLHQKKPEAIQKLLADSKFDPLTADVEKAAEYVPGDHRVSENEVQFQTVLEDVESTPTGPELIAEVAKQWDADSRQALFRDPRLLVEINNQKANGLYGRISEEVERRRVLGELQGVPFLAAYETVGKDLQAKGLLTPEGSVSPRQAPPVTRVVAPAPAVINNERARAAAPAKTTPASKKDEINPLAQSDDEFLKTMQGRL